MMIKNLISKLEVPVYLIMLSYFVYDCIPDLTGTMLSAFFLAIALFKGYLNFFNNNN
jgi:hypothetical protein